MIADLKPYPEYKESGLPWLGRVPEHWSVGRIKTVLRETDCRSIDGLGTLLSLTRVRGLIPHKEMTDKMHSAKTLVGYKRYRAGQLVMNRMQAWSGMFGAGETDGLVSPDYAVFDVLGKHGIKLVLERLKTADLVSQFALESKGIGSGFNRLYTDRFGAIPISLPPLPEQATIVRFLDGTNARLERAVRAKRKVIALLNEQKQAIIHRAVARGLNPSVPLKRSGIPWLGDIPQHWEALRSKYIYREVDNRSATGEETHLSMSQRFGLVPSSQIQEKRLVSESYAGAKLSEKGDLVLNRLKAHLGVFALARERGLVSPDYTVLRPVRELEERYFEAVYRTPACRVELRQRAKGIVEGFWRLYTDDFYNIRVPFPPLNEQKSIMAQLDIDLSAVNTTFARLEREIELLREYRTRLVAEVVTGKLDVREAAAQLPEEATPDTLEESADASDEAEPADEEVAV
jgi:type I restriction enzyme S subunit